MSKVIPMSVPEYKKLLAINQGMDDFWGEEKEKIKKLTTRLMEIQGMSVEELEKLITELRLISAKNEDRLNKLKEYREFMEELMKREHEGVQN